MQTEEPTPNSKQFMLIFEGEAEGTKACEFMNGRELLENKIKVEPFMKAVVDV